MALRIIVSGSLGSAPGGYAGNTWVFLQYLLGFRRLGCDTYYVEAIPASVCVDDHGQPVDFAQSANARHFDAVMRQYGLSDHAALLERDGTGAVGLSRATVERLSADTDLLVNISGRLHLASVLKAARRRAYIDLDPGYTQIWQQRYARDMNLRDHDVYFTVGLNLGQPDCPLPTCGVRWNPMLPPVVLSEWETQTVPGESYSTVADWRGFGEVEWDGVQYGQKRDEFLKILDLPRRVSAALELCLLIHPEEPERRTLLERGWRLASPDIRAGTPDAYRAYIQASRGEFTCAKPAYAAGRTGWFSDRSACYLAAGRPVITQDTGIGRYVPTGAGLLTFSDLDTAADAVDEVEHDYADHAAAAHDFARTHLDSDRVLTRLLHLAGLRP